ncbi:hypothetical protein [Anaerobacillus sp. 1_MG-2023]|uniref:hypothetical protein n=1 Tax=Anaerobacillus sp. 1_MG-2023 TaxID=3062655 RepID=UPI0026E3403A|nr:hypothetical protein [Anaerobacillus sp. 1_MG-2023]MDO6654633.1 hypothetical protein [Anaerobacillus sp. 1_MG-2023]
MNGDGRFVNCISGVSIHRTWRISRLFFNQMDCEKIVGSIHEHREFSETNGVTLSEKPIG